MARNTRAVRSSRDARLARRALKVLRKPGYVVTDVVRSHRSSPRPYQVVFVEQCWMGLSIYNGRRSVIFTKGKTQVTGRHSPVRSFAPVLPVIDAEKAVRVALKRTADTLAIRSVEIVSRSPGADRYTVLRVEPLSSPVTVHLVVFGTGRARLAWEVTTQLPNGHALDAVIDAASRKLLHRRITSHPAAAATLAITPEAGGPAAGAALKFTVEPRWLNPAVRRIECTADGVPMPAPVADANGDFGGPVASFTQTTLDGLVMANLGLDRLISVGGQTQGRVIMDLVSSGMINPGDIAMALPSLTKPTLIFTARFPGMRHAASDPSVVLHELAHLVLSRGVGGTQLARPFEGAGESGAAMEGLQTSWG